MTELVCNEQQQILPSAHIVFNISELDSVSDADECDESMWISLIRLLDVMVFCVAVRLCFNKFI